MYVLHWFSVTTSNSPSSSKYDTGIVKSSNVITELQQIMVDEIDEVEVNCNTPYDTTKGVFASDNMSAEFSASNKLFYIKFIISEI